MDEETKQILEKNLEISQESLKILKGIRRGRHLALAFKVTYWLVIFGVIIGAFYFLEPYVKNATGFLQEIRQMQSVLKIK